MLGFVKKKYNDLFSFLTLGIRENYRLQRELEGTYDEIKVLSRALHDVQAQKRVLEAHVQNLTVKHVQQVSCCARCRPRK